MPSKRGQVEGKVAIVTGAGSGIGRSIAQLLASEGAAVVFADIDSRAAKRAAKDATESCHSAMLDVRSAMQWDKLVESIIKSRGRLDVLVNCAGIQLTRGLLETSLEDFQHVFEVNMQSVFLGTRAGVRAMLPRKTGSIINVASNYANVADALNTAYCASKAAVAHFTKAAALDCASRGTRIRVNSIHPGFIQTPLLEREIEDVTRQRGDPDDSKVRAEWENIAPLGLGSPEDIGWLAVYLASDRSQYATGSEFIVDGGYVIR